MIQARFGVFETNSSSTHSMIICTEEEYQKLKDNELYLDEWSDKVITRDDALMRASKDSGYTTEELEKMDSERLSEILHEFSEIVSLYDWREYLDHDYNHFTTPSGDQMVAICAYGHD